MGSEKLDLNIITEAGKESPTGLAPAYLQSRETGTGSRERGFAHAARACWEREKFDIVQSMSVSLVVTSFGQAMAFIVSGLNNGHVLFRPCSVLAPASAHIIAMFCRQKPICLTPALKAVICNSEMVKKDILRCFALQADKIHVIHNAIDSTRFQPATEAGHAVRTQLNLPANAMFDLCGFGI